MITEGEGADTEGTPDKRRSAEGTLVELLTQRAAAGDDRPAASGGGGGSDVAEPSLPGASASSAFQTVQPQSRGEYMVV